MVRKTINPAIPIKTVPTNDNRSYHVSSKKIREELGFVPKHSIEEAILDLKKAFEAGKIPDPMNDIRYYNIKTMQALKLK
jgi:nucleoside-diphosphate-sugar epimerase